MSKMLIVFYSWSNGNTERIAKELQKATGADIATIETVVPYEGSYDEVVNQGQDEVQRGFMPKIKELPYDVADYDVIAIGTPTWWYTMAPAVLTFIKEHDWKGKRVVPFMTNGGWPGHVIKDIEKNCVGASFSNEMQIKFDSTGGANMQTTQKVVDEWVKAVVESL